FESVPCGPDDGLVAGSRDSPGGPTTTDCSRTAVQSSGPGRAAPPPGGAARCAGPPPAGGPRWEGHDGGVPAHGQSGPARTGPAARGRAGRDEQEQRVSKDEKDGRGPAVADRTHTMRDGRRIPAIGLG